jgi:hypothetical protein
MYTPAGSNAIIYFNTDDPAPDNYNSVVLFIKDRAGNTYMTVDYLEQRFDENQTFGFRFTPTGALYTATFPKGPVAYIYFSYP